MQNDCTHHSELSALLDAKIDYSSAQESQCSHFQCISQINLQYLEYLSRNFTCIETKTTGITGSSYAACTVYDYS